MTRAWTSPLVLSLLWWDSRCQNEVQRSETSDGLKGVWSLRDAVLDGGSPESTEGKSSSSVWGWEPEPASRTRPGPRRHGSRAPHLHSQRGTSDRLATLGYILRGRNTERGLLSVCEATNPGKSLTGKKGLEIQPQINTSQNMNSPFLFHFLHR